MKIKILTDIQSIPIEQWEELQETSLTRSFFQTRECYDLYASNPGFMIPFCVAVLEDNVLKGVIIGYIQRDGGKIKQFFSRRAIINGGPLLADSISEEAFTFLVTVCKKILKGKAIYIESRNFEDFTKYKHLFERCGFCYVPHVNFHIDTSTEEVIEKNLGKSRKRDIRVSLRDGAEIVEDPSVDEVRAFYLILYSLYKTKVKTPLYPLSFFERLYNKKYSKFLLVRYENRIVGGTVCVGLPDYAIYEWFACGEDNLYKNIHPSTVATYAGIRYAARHNFQYFDMMGAGKPNEHYGVREFKAKFGGKLVEHGRFQAVLNPFLYEIGKIGVKIIKKF